MTCATAAAGNGDDVVAVHTACKVAVLHWPRHGPPTSRALHRGQPIWTAGLFGLLEIQAVPLWLVFSYI